MSVLLSFIILVAGQGLIGCFAMAPFSNYAADIQALEIDDDYRANLAEILSWDIVPTRCMSPSVLRRLALQRGVEAHLRRMGLWELLSRLSAARTYPVLVAEFLATYSYDFDGLVSFRLRGRSYILNVIQFNMTLDLIVGGFRYPHVARSTRERTWRWLMGGAPLDGDYDIRVEDLSDPALRYAFLAVSHALFPSKFHHGNVVTPPERQLLSMVYPSGHGLPPDMGHCIALELACVAESANPFLGRKEVSIGSLVTLIATCLGVDLTDLAELPEVRLIDLDYLCRCGLVTMRVDPPTDEIVVEYCPPRRASQQSLLLFPFSGFSVCVCDFMP